MENASKALIIAGAILISILIIGVGMFVYQSATGTIEGAVSQMSVTEKNMYNQQFEQYAGTKVNGSNVKALIQKIRDNNSTYDGVDAKTVKLTLNNASVTDFGTTISNIISAGSYTVVCTDANPAGDGLIDTVTITYNKK